MDLVSTNRSNETNGSAVVPEMDPKILNALIIMSCFIIAAAFFSNVVVLAATYKDRRLHKPGKYFVASLAVSDLLVAMLSLTMRLVVVFLNIKKPMTLVFCYFWIWVDIFTEATSISTVTIICIDRYYKVSRPFRYKINMTTHRACRIIVFLWMYSAVLGVLGLIPYRENKGVHTNYSKKCLNDNKIFYTLAAILIFFLPVVILVILCTLIFRIVQNHSKKLLTNLPNHDICSRKNNHKRQYSNRRSLITLALIVFTFIICWGPFFVIFLISQYKPSLGLQNNVVLQSVCFVVLPYSNSFFNPIIYAFFDKTFNMAIKDMIFGRKKKGTRNNCYFHKVLQGQTTKTTKTCLKMDN